MCITELFNRKCKFAKNCKHYRENAHTCNDPQEWKEYCGIAREQLKKD